MTGDPASTAPRGILLDAPPPPDGRSGDPVSDLRNRIRALIDGPGPGLRFEEITHIHSGTRVGSEALARFPGPVGTADWIRLAHDVGLGDELELRIVGDVIDSHRPTTSELIGINVSPSCLIDPRLHRLVERAIDPTGRPHLVIELTDHTVVRRPADLFARLEQLRRRGARLAVHVSEFGAAPMRLLTTLRPEVVKLDPHLTSALIAGRIAASASAPLFSFCRHHAVFVVAVGATPADPLRPLADVGVDACQGTTPLTGVPRHR